MTTNPYVAIHHLKALALARRHIDNHFYFIKGLLYNEHLKIPSALQKNRFYSISTGIFQIVSIWSLHSLE